MVEANCTALGLPGFDDERCIAYLQARMRDAPAAESWPFTMSIVCGYGDDWEIEATSLAEPRASWSATWPTGEHASAIERLTPPARQIEELLAWLRQTQIAHVEAVGGPLDGIAYYFDVRRTQTRVALLL